MNEAIGVVRDTLDEFAQNGPTDKELADAKTYLTGSFPLSFSSNVGIVGELNGFQQVGLPVDYIQKRNALIDAVTAGRREAGGEAHLQSARHDHRHRRHAGSPAPRAPRSSASARREPTRPDHLNGLVRIRVQLLSRDGMLIC